MFIRFLVILLIPVISLFVLSQRVYAQVVINEVMADPAAASDASEWAELYNAGSSPVALQNWKLDGKTITEPITIPANGFIVFTKNLAAFKTEFGDLAGVYELAIGLTNSGDSLSLVDPNGLTDTLTYTVSSPNRSWERTGPLCTEVVLHPTSHTALAINSNIRPECQSSPLPQVDNPIEPEASIEFSADGTNWASTISLSGPAVVHLRALLNDDPGKYIFKWSLADGTNITDTPSLSSYIDQPLNLTLVQGDKEWSFVSANISIIPALNVSEVLANSALDTWMEIYNPNDFAVKGGFQLFLNGSAVPASLDMASKSYQIVKLKNLQCESGCHLSLKSSGIEVSNLLFDTMPVDQSWSLDGTGNWHNDWQVTPGTLNLAKVVAELPVNNSLQISEIYPSPDTSKGESEWFEVYNYSDAEIDLAGWTATDTSKTFSLSGKVPAYGYLAFEKPGISLNNSGDVISLINPKGLLIDSFSYPSTPTAAVQIRQYADGKYSSGIMMSLQATPGKANVLVEKESVAKDSGTKTVVIKSPVSSSSSSAAAVLGTVSPYKIPSLALQGLIQQNIEADTTNYVELILPWVIIAISASGVVVYYLWNERTWIADYCHKALARVKQFRLDLVPG